MRATFHIFYNGESSKDVGLSVVSRPTIPVPKREYETIKIEGRDGELYRDKGTYEDIEIKISFNFVSKNPDVWAQALEEFRKMLESNDSLYDYVYDTLTVAEEDTEEDILRKAVKGA